MSISVEVVYALPQLQRRILLDLPSDSTVLDAVQASGLLQHLQPGQFGRVGVWGRPVMPETRLRDQDRAEIYRPLTADPKKARRERAAKVRKQP
ncbi:MAG: RnfH family protein [Proteobacteria bacterium]|nr:RnfH family protein [Pseudomonadota bacterium]